MSILKLQTSGYQDELHPKLAALIPIGARQYYLQAAKGGISFQLIDLYMYENNKEFYNSKLYKHLAGYNDEET
jgi:hypothetical protein